MKMRSQSVDNSRIAEYPLLQKFLRERIVDTVSRLIPECNIVCSARERLIDIVQVPFTCRETIRRPASMQTESALPDSKAS